jgi:hypothetical protein
MATQIQWRRGTTAQTASFTGAVGEATVDTSKNTLVIHDGTTAGGFPLARESALSANATQIQASFNQANTAFIAATSAGIYANGAFVSSNTIQTYVTSANANISVLFSYVNTANANITAAFVRANNSLDTTTGGSITGDLTVTGNLTISGTTTYANTQQLLVGDNLITLNAELPTSVTPIESAGIEINRGNTFANSSLLWVESAGKWQANTGSATGAYFLADEAVANGAFAAANSAATTDFTNVSVAAGTYGNTTHYGVVTVAANGRVTSVSTFPVVDSSAIAFSIALG